MKVKVLVAQSCLTLCNPVDCSPPGSSVLVILQARILERVAIPSPGDLPNPGIKPRSPALQADSLPAEPLGKPLIYNVVLASGVQESDSVVHIYIPILLSEIFPM